MRTLGNSDFVRRRWRPRTWATLGLWLLAAALLFLSGRRVLVSNGSAAPDHDETISLMAATGHQLDYGRPDSGTRMALEDVHRVTQVDADRGMGDLLLGLRERDIHPPLFFMVARGWLLLGSLGDGASSGSGRTAAAAADRWRDLLPRLLIFTSTLVLLLGGLLSRGPPSRAGLLAGAAVIPALPYVAAQAHNFRPYPLVLLLTSLLLVLCLNAVERDRIGPRAALLIGLVGGCGLLTHYLFAPVLVAGLLGLALSGRVHSFRAAALAGFVCGLVALPWLLFVGVPEPPSYMIHGSDGVTAGWHRVLSRLTEYFGFSKPIVAGVWLALVGGLAVVGRREPSARLLALCGSFPLLLPAIYDFAQGGRLLSKDRAAVAVIPALVVGVGWFVGLALRRFRMLVVLGAGLWLALCPALEREGRTSQERLGAAVEKQALIWERDRGASPTLLVGLNWSARGWALRKLRYLPPTGELLFLPASEISSLATSAPRDGLAVLVWRRNVGYGRSKSRLASSELREFRGEMKKKGWKRVAKRNRKRSGWEVWSAPKLPE